MSGHYKRESIESLDYLPDLVNPGVLEEFALQYLFQPFIDFQYRDYLMFLPDAEQEIFTHFIPVTADTDELLISTGFAYHISETSQNKEFAWEFIKFLTTPEANENLSLVGMPVNRELVKNFAPSNMRWNINNYKGKGFTIDGEEADVVTQVMSELAHYNELPMKCYQPGRGIDNKFYKDEIIAFLDGFLTAEQAASAIQNKVSLYLAE
jgi:ABC-type glycerol-3-phosphate transport system substrate-binding protein